ncbi:AAC(3) family N-acetyltransferase [candidate division WOR-3 bacterium]|nr:AAC(3) family N-acetyltransferase [candidate division WOR-3 bacterium]
MDAAVLRGQLAALGVRPGDLLVVKASLSALGPVEGGAKGLLRALLDAVGPDGTLVTLAFVDCYPVPLSREHARLVTDERTPSYAGALANVMVGHPAMRRSRHPIQKFCAIGRLAAELVDNHTPASPAYDVLRRVAELGGRHLKLGPDERVPGFGTTHVAQNLLGFRQRLPRRGVMFRDETGAVRLFEANWAGGCSRGFNSFIPLYERGGAFVGRGRVGDAEASITGMNRTLAIDLEVLARDPRFFFCNDPSCYSCRVSWDFSPRTPRWYAARYVLPPLRALGLGRLRRALRGNRG